MKDYTYAVQQYSQAQRTASQELVESLVNSSAWKGDRLTQTVAYACVWSRVFAGVNATNYTSRILASLEYLDVDEELLLSTVQRVNQVLFHAEDEDGNLIFDSTGGLSNDTKWSLEEIANHLQFGLPGIFLPTAEPCVTTGPSQSTGTRLINSKLWRQMPKFMPRFYEALNAMQAQPYTLNADMLALRALPVGFDLNSNTALRNRRIKEWDCFKNVFYFRYTFDYRGRAYARSVLLQPQGDSFSKAYIDSADAKPLGKYGYNALAIHFANVAGDDKASFMDRIHWAKTEGIELAKQIARCNRDWRAIEKLVGADNFEAYTAALDFLRATLSGNPAGYRSSLILHQDATNSGFQFGAALTGDRETAELVNITSTLTKLDKPADIYGVMALTLQRIIAEQRDEWLNQWLPAIDRSFCKKPIMTTGYGAGLKTVMLRLETYMDELANDKTQFRELVARTQELKPFVEQALAETAGTMLHITDVMQSHVSTILLTQDHIEWVTPDGFIAYQQKRDRTSRRVELQRNGKVVAAMYLAGEEIDPVDDSGMTTATSPNFVHSIDAQMLRTAAIYAYNAGIAFTPIHDSFGTHAATFFELHSILKRSFVETMEYPWYSRFCERNNVAEALTPLGDYDAAEASQAVYIFS